MTTRDGEETQHDSRGSLYFEIPKVVKATPALMADKFKVGNEREGAQKPGELFVNHDAKCFCPDRADAGGHVPGSCTCRSLTVPCLWLSQPGHCGKQHRAKQHRAKQHLPRVMTE